ncbi:MAG: lamin tail domain-containing protein, partial [bacterium]|nr:lamin tail domain-containing protein [bacterium]
MKIKRILFTFLFSVLVLINVFGANTRDVVINEIAWMGTVSSTSDEWIELYNNTDSPIDMTGWTMEDDNGIIDMSFTGIIIPARGYVLIENSEDTVNDVTGDLIDSSISLSNTGEKITLKDNFGNTIDVVGVTATMWYAGNSSPIYTMERKNPTVEGTNSSNWANNDGITKNGLDADGNPINGTPKSMNSVAEGGTAVYILIEIDRDRIETTAGTPNATVIEVKLVDADYFID